MSKPISLIIPTLNAEGELGGFVEVHLEQSRILDEIIVVDSSSDDRTAEIASSFREVAVEVVYCQPASKVLPLSLRSI